MFIRDRYEDFATQPLLIQLAAKAMPTYYWSRLGALNITPQFCVDLVAWVIVAFAVAAGLGWMALQDVYKRQIEVLWDLLENLKVFTVVVEDHYVDRVYSCLLYTSIASNRGSACRGEYVPGPCTHRPSHHESRGDPKSIV